MSLWKFQKIEKEKMSYAGIGNTVAGLLLASILKFTLTPNSNKPATKADVLGVLDKLNGHYHLVKNMTRDEYGHSLCVL